MAALRLGLAALAALFSSPAAADPVERWRSYVSEAAARFSLPEEWITRVIRVESGGRTTIGGRPIVSSKGAMGLMQLMPGTWAAMRAAYRLGPNPHEPRDNILAGAAYLRRMYDRFGYPGLFAAYNAGPARYAASLRGRPLPRETIRYVGIVAATDPIAQAAPRPLGIFVTVSSAKQSAVAPASHAIFVSLRTSSRR